MSKPGASLLGDIWLDMKGILANRKMAVTPRNMAWAVFACDGFAILAMFRTRQWCRRHHIPVVNRVVRGLETALYAIELGNDIELGHGVYFLHSVGTVVGGDAKIGAGCVFLGNNTIGTSGGPGAPRIGSHTVIAAGARVLGNIDIGENCVLGANSVVVRDVPSGKVAVGIPARISGDNPHLLPRVDG